MPFEPWASWSRRKNFSMPGSIIAEQGFSRLLILIFMAVFALGATAGVILHNTGSTPSHSFGSPAAEPGATAFMPDPSTAITVRYQIPENTRYEPPPPALQREHLPRAEPPQTLDHSKRAELSATDRDPHTPSAPAVHPKSSVIKSLLFERGSGGVESVFIEADEAMSPKVSLLQGENPFGSQVRLVVDVKNVSSVSDSVSDSEANGSFITRVRTSHSPVSQNFRAVLDLADDAPLKFTEALSEDGRRFAVHISGTKEKDAPEQGLRILSVAFKPGNVNGSDLLLIQANRCFEPLVFGLEGAGTYSEHDRIVVDVTGVEKPSLQTDLISGTGRVVKGVRHHYYTGERKLRLVLDLVPAAGYSLSQTFHTEQNLYSLSVTYEGSPPSTKRSVSPDPPRTAAETPDHLSARPHQDPSPLPETGVVETTVSEEGSALRALPADLTGVQVRNLMVRHGFYSTCGIYNSDYCNPDGGFANRFVDCEEGFVCDEATGLMWERGGSREALTWNEAGGHIEDLNRRMVAGRRDWRMPTIEELLSIMESSWTGGGLFIDGRFDTTPRTCWSSDTKGTGKAWKANFHLGYVVSSMVEERNWVRGVRTLENSSGRFTETP